MNQPKLKYSSRLRSTGAAAGALVLASGAASASVLVVNVGEFLPEGFGFLSFDPVGSSFVNAYDTGYTAGVRNCGFNLLHFGDADFEWADSILAAGITVDGSLSYSAAGSFEMYPADGEVVFAGYRMNNQGTGNDETHYGYVKVTGFPDNGFQVDSYSYESSPNTAIVTAVPEPSALLLGTFAFGAAGLVRRRRQ